MKPTMMKNLLKKLIEDLPTLQEYTIVPLKMLTLWYERCGRYYGAGPIGQASEEEKKLTMTLFTRIFDSLARRVIDKISIFVLFIYFLRLMIQSCSAKHFHVCQL